MAANTIIGYGFQQADLSTSDRNVIIGYKAGLNLNTNITDNTIIGYNTARNLVNTCAGNIAIGNDSLLTASAVNNNTIIGYNNASGLSSDGNVVLGSSAGTNITTGINNIAIGLSPMSNTVGLTGSNNLTIGFRAGFNINGAADSNIYLGPNSGVVATTGSNNVAMGPSSLSTVTIGSNNVALGNLAAASVFTGSDNIAVGRQAMYNGGTTVTGARNIAIGPSDNSYLLSGGADNIALGYNAGSSISTGSSNVAIGATAMGDVFNITGSNNTAIGNLAGRALNGAASSNTYIGTQAGTNMTSGSDNICIGNNAGNTGTGSNNLFIGNGAGTVTAANSSNRLIIRQNATTLVDGDFSTNSFTSGGVTHTAGTVTQTSYTDLGELGADPATPASGYGRLYARNDGSLKYTNDGGTTYNLTTPTASTSAEVLTADGAVSTTITYTIFNSATPLTMTLANPTVATQKFLTTINGTEASVTLANGQLVKIGVNQTVSLVYDPGLGYWTTTAGNSNAFLDQDQTGAFNSVTIATDVALSNDGNTMAIGYYTFSAGQGKVDVYTRSGSTWSFQQTLVNGPSIQQGCSVSLDSTGDHLLVGAPDFMTPGVGQVDYWTRSAGTWTYQSSFTPSDPTGNSNFGCNLKMDSAASVAIIGGSGDNANVGAVWFFSRTGTTWTQIALKHVGTTYTGTPYQGSVTTISEDGLTAAESGSLNNANVGAVWVFRYSGGVWTQYNNLITIPTGGTVNGYTVTYFGSGLALSSDGTRLLISGATASGGGYNAIFMYYQDTSLGFALNQGYNLNSSFQGGTTLPVQCSYDGNQVIVGIPRNSVSPYVNYAAILAFENGQYSTKALTNNSTVNQDMGDRVAISGDGSTYAVAGTFIVGSSGTYVKV